MRFAHAHGYKVQTMCLYLFGRDRSIWNRDIDKFAPDWVQEAMMKATGATSAQFAQTTLRAFEGVVVDQVKVNGAVKGFIPLGILHRIRTHGGLMWCPLCLREDRDPYFRKVWRLAYFTVCIRHRIYLEDTCHCCGAPIAPHRSDMLGRGIVPTHSLIVHCYRCHTSLLEYQSDLADEPSVRLQTKFELALTQGYVPWPGNSSLHSLLFFEGVHALIAGLISKRGRQRLLAASAFAGSDLSQWPASGWERAPLVLRRQLMQFAARLLDDWPVNFVALIHECRLRYSDLKGDRAFLPFWYQDVIRREAFRFISPVSAAHAESIANAVETHFGRFNGILARQFSGRDVLAKVPFRRICPVSPEQYHDLLTSLDHEIAGTTDRDLRLDLLRDKIMFAAGHIFGLSTTRLSMLTLHDCHALVPAIEEPDFLSAPTTPAQARAWIEWYWTKLRPASNPAATEQRIFVSAKTGRALKKSAISVRFSRAVSQAGLNRSIPTYTTWKKAS